MSIEITKKGKQEYAYFYPGREKKLYLGSITEGRLKLENIIKAIDYINQKIERYDKLKRKLISYVPEEDRHGIQKNITPTNFKEILEQLAPNDLIKIIKAYDPKKIAEALELVKKNK